MAESKICFNYIIQCNDNSFYTGICNNPAQRWLAHLLGKGARYVKQKGFNKAVYLSYCKTKSEAMKEEKRIKRLSKDKKWELINSQKDSSCLLFMIFFNISAIFIKSKHL